MVNILTLKGKDGKPFQVNQLELQDNRTQPKVAERVGLTIEEFKRRFPRIAPKKDEADKISE
ncbi:hypothetical protein HN512_00580 [Candidatus Peregrinibacteria bacterium]|jgi:hypothetical protein|nr:hypothetical protein [Candidatus Peregrinibacteria bacterium]MBT3598318.1 hypothetical protein [Candidatus Peregrinibacteria bacterium]MBT6730520.1 hypothetical protein [Candidatus Peregrinibacteria bacterium]MBT7009646.1 hypothetical protein [Candidatus Peregrinibacteria bacterium]MBT7345139.1 hypothetical protein [Candidatus Peregrinibacteria bacterium]